MLPSYHDMAHQADTRRDELLRQAARHELAQKCPTSQTGPGPLNNALGKLGDMMVNAGEELQARRGDWQPPETVEQQSLNSQHC